MSRDESETRTRILDATWRLLEERKGQGVRMGDIAKAAGISRQALYLHFASRTELMIATAVHVDEVKRLADRLATFEEARTGAELLDKVVDVWGNYIPEIYGLAGAMLATRDSDAAMAAAWNDRMACLRDACREVIVVLEAEGTLAPAWSPAEAVEMLYMLISIENWQQLRLECGWSNDDYVARMKTAVKRLLLGEAP